MRSHERGRGHRARHLSMAGSYSRRRGPVKPGTLPGRILDFSAASASAAGSDAFFTQLPVDEPRRIDRIGSGGEQSDPLARVARPATPR
jgi:hypothetical protein